MIHQLFQRIFSSLTINIIYIIDERGHHQLLFSIFQNKHINKCTNLLKSYASPFNINSLAEMSQSHPIEEFHFPMQILKYRTIKSWKHFNQLIKKENIPLRRDVSFQSTIITGSDGSQTLSIQCKQCEAFFRYINLKKGQPFTLRECNQLHQHVLRQTQSFHQSIIERIQKFLQQDDGKLQKHQLCADICVNYRISSKQFQQLYSQAAERLKRNTLLYDGKQIDDLVKKLKNQRFTVLGDYLNSKIDRENRTITKSIIIFNDQMVINYKKYGQSCFIAVDDRRPINRWNVGAIMGVGRDMELTLFGLMLLKTADSDHLKGILRAFFNKMQLKPQTIITQTSYFYEQAMVQLKTQGFLFAEHYFDYATHSEKLHRHNPKLKKIFGQLSRQPQKRKFFRKLNQLYISQNFSQYDVDLEQLAGQADRLCLSQIKPLPVGPYRTIRNKLTQKKYDYSVLRTFFKVLYQRECNIGKHLYSKVKNILTLLLEPVSEDVADHNRIMDIFQQLRVIRQLVNKNVMDYLMAKVYSSIQLRIKRMDDDRYQAFEGKQYFIVSKVKDKWACECEQSPKTMLPCVHEMAVCCKTAFPLDVQIGSRWTNEDERLEEEMRRKLSRKPRNKRVTLSQFLA